MMMTVDQAVQYRFCDHRLKPIQELTADVLQYHEPDSECRKCDDAAIIL